MKRDHLFFSFSSAAAVAAGVAPSESRPRLTSPNTLVGYAILWNVPSDDRGGYKVMLAPGSVTFETPTRALYNHDRSKALGTTANGSLRFQTNKIGVRVEIDLPKTTLGRDTAIEVADEYVSGMSFNMLKLPWGFGPGGPIPIAGQSKVAVVNGVKVVTALAFRCNDVTVTGDPSFVDSFVGVAGGREQYSRRQLDRLRLDHLRTFGV